MPSRVFAITNRRVKIAALLVPIHTTNGEKQLIPFTGEECSTHMIIDFRMYMKRCRRIPPSISGMSHEQALLLYSSAFHGITPRKQQLTSCQFQSIDIFIIGGIDTFSQTNGVEIYWMLDSLITELRIDQHTCGFFVIGFVTWSGTFEPFQQLDLLSITHLLFM